ncbi:unnamed protein product, partial [Choristocarpus tenellus]
MKVLPCASMSPNHDPEALDQTGSSRPYAVLFAALTALYRPLSSFISSYHCTLCSLSLSLSLRGGIIHHSQGSNQRSLTFPSGLEMERLLLPFDAVPRIPLGPREGHVFGGGSGGSFVQGAGGGGVKAGIPTMPLLLPPVKFSPSGRFLYSGGHEAGAVLVWQMDLGTGQVMGEMALQGHSGPVTCLASAGLESSGQDLLLSGSTDGTAMLWNLGRLASTFRSPEAMRAPAMVVRGHGSAITACALSDGLGLALTCSSGNGIGCSSNKGMGVEGGRGRALLHCTEGATVVRALPSPPPIMYHRLHRNKSRARAEGDAGAGGAAAAVQYTACALGLTGYAALASSSLSWSDLVVGQGGASAGLVPGSSEGLLADAAGVSNKGGSVQHALEVFTVNGRRTARLVPMARGVRCLSVVGRGELLVIGGEGLLLEVRTMADLAPLWGLDPHSWTSIDFCLAPGDGGSGGGSSRAGAGAGHTTGHRRAGGLLREEDLPAVECVELGPNPDTPAIMCVGTSDGTLLVMALPDAEEWLSHG